MDVNPNFRKCLCVGETIMKKMDPKNEISYVYAITREEWELIEK